MKPPFQSYTYLDLLPEDQSLENYRLVIFFKESGVSYVILSPSSQIVLGKELFNKDGLSSEIFLRLLFEKDPILKKKFADCRIISGNPAFALVPYNAMSDRRLLHLARILLDETAFEEEIVSHPLDHVGAWTLFPNQSSVAHILEEYIPNYTLSHISDPLTQLCLSANAKTALFLLVFDHYAMLAALKDGTLHLCNAYTFRADLDIIYFMQSVRQVTGLDNETIPIWVLGEVENRLKMLQSHLPDVRFPDRLAAYLPSGLKLPYWKFAYLAL